jgi:exosortase/archaeosortase family protein
MPLPAIPMKKKKHASASSPGLKEAVRRWCADNGPVLRFGLKFAALVAILYILLAIPFFEQGLLYYLEANAWFSNIILKAFRQATHVSGVIIESARFSMAIRRGCDAVEPTWLFCAAIVAFPALPRRKVLGIVVGIILLQVLNLIRIVTLYMIGIYIPAFCNTAHLEIWPVIFIIAAIILIVCCNRWDWEDAS